MNGARWTGVAALGAAAWTIAESRRRAKLPPAPRAVLVTGGSRGLGLLLAREYLRSGARVAICARDAAELERAKSQLDAAEGRPVLALPCDVADADQVRELVASVRLHFGRIDALVNNAGVIQVGPFEHMTRADYEEAMRVHFWAPLQVTAEVLPDMRRRRAGRIVNVASIAGVLPVPHLLPYDASKAALVGWSDGMRAELARDNVVVTTVCPALIRTGSPRHGVFKGRHRDEYAWFSVADSLPVLAASADRTARRIVRASQLGRARVVVPAWARLPAAAYAAFPGVVLGALALTNRLLPAPGGVGEAGVPGAESTSDASPSWWTALGERAARRNNER
ncbi:MAG: ketoacyl reductase [Proteobacteria bacterium]|nr:MAG: ketoacyl reductase [Pseudomonadota bacterium]